MLRSFAMHGRAQVTGFLKSATGPLVVLQLPSPLAKAIGMLAQPGVWRTSAMSVRAFQTTILRLLKLRGADFRSHD